MSKTIDINLSTIEDISKSCLDGNGGVADKVDDLQDQIKGIRELLDDVNGLTFRRMDNYLDDVSSEIRGIENNVHDLGKGARKYYKRMSDIDTIIDESQNVFVSEEISKFQSRYKHTGSYTSSIGNIKRAIGGLRSLNISGVNQAELSNLNNLLTSEVDSIISLLDSMSNTISEANKNLKTVEDIKSKDYYESFHIGVAVGAAIVLTIVAAPLEAVVLGAEATVLATLAFDAAFAAGTTAVKSTYTNHRDGSNWVEAGATGTVDGVKAGAGTLTIGSVIGVSKSSLKNVDGMDAASHADVNTKSKTKFKDEIDSKRTTKKANVNKETKSETVKDIKGTNSKNVEKDIDWLDKVYGDDFVSEVSKEGLSAAKDEIISDLKYGISEELNIDEEDVTVKQELEELISIVSEMRG